MAGEATFDGAPSNAGGLGRDHAALFEREVRERALACADFDVQPAEVRLDPRKEPAVIALRGFEQLERAGAFAVFCVRGIGHLPRV